MSSDPLAGVDVWFRSGFRPFDEPWYRYGRVIDLVERHAPIPAGAKWLDLGCQIGQFLKYLNARHPIAATGIDSFNEGNIVEVCRKFIHIEISAPREIINDSWRYFSRAIDKDGIKLDEKFPYISALEVLEHMVDTDAFLEDCRAHLEPGGYLVVSTPNINSLRNRIQVPFGAYPAGLEYKTLVHHVRLYNVPMLEAHMKEHGFERIAVYGVSFLPARWLRFGAVRALDAFLADRFASLCGNLIGIFKAPGRG